MAHITVTNGTHTSSNELGELIVGVNGSVTINNGLNTTTIATLTTGRHEFALPNGYRAVASGTTNSVSVNTTPNPSIR